MLPTLSSFPRRRRSGVPESMSINGLLDPRLCGDDNKVCFRGPAIRGPAIRTTTS
jgi:hypothetical protein